MMRPEPGQQHPPHHRAGHGEGGLQVQVDHGVDVLVGDQCDHAVARDAGVVDQHVDAAEALDHVVHERSEQALPSTRSSGSNMKRPSSAGSAAQALGAIGRRAAAGGDGVAGLEERVDDPGAEPAAAARARSPTRRRSSGHPCSRG